jgi:prepilin-type N-terminal cleavage/methylation domain-containing protein/prepilin-type processing-associated H-X9-DG protein
MRLPSSSGELRLRRAGFTLIELLVVIAIIALLAAILFPVFARARENARKASCQSNLKQLGLTINMYAQDYDQFMPISGAAAGGDVVGLLEPYTSQRAGAGIWQCPSHGELTNLASWTTSYGYNWQYLLQQGTDTYPHNGWNGLDSPGLSVSQLARPTETLCFMDQRAIVQSSLNSYVVRPNDPELASNPNSLNGQGIPDFRHNGMGNVLFCDGHVKAMTPAFAAANNESKFWDPR